MLPYFYHPGIVQDSRSLTLDEDNSRHCVQVLRMEPGDNLLLTNGKGIQASCVITLAHRKHCQVTVENISIKEPRRPGLSVGIAFTKNNSRNEWFLEKATEAGIEHVYPLNTVRSEKDKLKLERLQQILISGMLQSQQVFLPKLHELTSFKKMMQLSDTFTDCQKLIAHCLDETAKRPFLKTATAGKDLLLLIGPEGDFTEEEVSLCVQHGFKPVGLGENRLRTETAALYGCIAFNALNYG